MPGGVRRYVGAFAADQGANAIVYVLLGWVTAVNSGHVVGTLGVVGLAGVMKFLVSMFAGGVVGDRYGPARVVRWSLFIRIVLLLLLGVVAARGNIAGLAVLGGAYGAVDGAHGPAFQALSTVVGKPRGQRSLQGWMDLARRIFVLPAGPVTAWAISLWSPILAALIGSGLLITARLTLPPAGDARVNRAVTLGAGTAEGWRVIAHTPGLARKLGLFAMANLCLTPLTVAAVPLLAQEHGWSVTTYGWVAMAYVAGSIGGTLAVGWWGNNIQGEAATRGALLSLVPTCLAVAAIGLPMSEDWRMAGSLLCVAGISSGFGPSLLGGVIKEETPEEFQSRVQAARVSAIVAGAPLGYLLLGGLTATLPVPLAIAGLGVLLLIVVAIFTGLERHASSRRRRSSSRRADKRSFTRRRTASEKK